MADFASYTDVSTRLGRTLTSAEQAAVTAVLTVVAGLIRDEVGKLSSWNPSPVPAALKEVSIQKAISALANPEGFASFSETLGAHSHSATVKRSQDVGTLLSEEEGRMLRAAVFGKSTDSSTPESLVDGLIDLAEGRDVGEDPS